MTGPRLANSSVAWSASKPLRRPICWKWRVAVRLGRVRSSPPSRSSVWGPPSSPRSGAAIRRVGSLAASLLPLLLYFLVHALHARVQPNWLAPPIPRWRTTAAIAASAPWPRTGVDRMPRLTVAGAGARRRAGRGSRCLHAVRPLVFSAKDPEAGQMRGWRPCRGGRAWLRLAHGACSVATSHYTITAQLAYHLPSAVPVVPLNEPLRYAHLPPADAATVRCPALYVELVRRPLPAGTRRALCFDRAPGHLHAPRPGPPDRGLQNLAAGRAADAGGGTQALRR